MNKNIFSLVLIIFIATGMISCNNDGKTAITDFMPKLSSKSLITKTGYDFLNQANINRSISTQKSLSRSFQANEEDKKFILDVLNHIKNIDILSRQETNTINELIENINSPKYTSTINDIYSILKINNITTSSTKKNVYSFYRKNQKRNL